jgi:UDP-2,4-diacetamido-2,4,6-trideoxy-beta-L-altropyranose hydrolase
VNVAIRCDASYEIGTGHVMRCLTLADQLRGMGGEVTFISREHAGNINDVIEKHGFSVHRLPFIDTHSGRDFESEYARWLAVSPEKDIHDTVAWLREQKSSIDLLVVDHYALDAEWEIAARPLVSRIMVIDDLANRRHDCDLLLDQNYFEDFEGRYDGLVPDHCRLLLGPGYALLRPEFIRARSCLQKRDGVVRRVLVFFGGVDPTDETSKALRALTTLTDYELKADVVVGQTNPHRAAVEKRCRQIPGMAYHAQVDNMAELMARAGLGLGAGGVTTYERCCLGLPTLITAIAKNQIAIGKGADEHGVARYLGRSSEVTAEMIAETMTPFLKDATIGAQMAAKARALVDGHGAQRVAEELFRLCERNVLV